MCVHTRVPYSNPSKLLSISQHTPYPPSAAPVLGFKPVPTPPAFYNTMLTDTPINKQAAVGLPVKRVQRMEGNPLHRVSPTEDSLAWLHKLI